MRPRSKHSPKTPAERQRKCRAIKRGEWHYIPGVQVDAPPQLPRPERDPSGRPRPARAAASGHDPRGLPAPAAPPVPAIEKAPPAAPVSPPALGAPAAADASALALLSDLVTSSHASR